MQVSQDEQPRPEIVLNTGGCISGPAVTAPPRQLARDNYGRIGEVMARPDEIGTHKQYYLRPVGGGKEWPVQPENIELLDHEPAS